MFIIIIKVLSFLSTRVKSRKAFVGVEYYYGFDLFLQWRFT